MTNQINQSDQSGLIVAESADQCAKRWQHHLDPQLNLKEWTKDEDEQLLQALQKMGRNWKSIRDQRFHGRSRNDVKNRYTILTRRASSSTSATTKRNTPDTENDEDDEHDRAFSAAGQDTMDLGPFPTPFSSYDFGTATMSPTEHAFSLSFSMDDIIDLDNPQVDHSYPFDASPDQFDLLNMTHVEPSVNDMLGVDNKALWQEDSCISPMSCGRQSAGQSTYKRVTLVLEDYDKGLMDQLLHIVSTSQGKSQIEIMP
ncbi:REB1, Myb superfamily protein, transcription factor and mRNA splicing factor [Pyrenophora tritici-repentis]|nr:REB1, Myb superfamily protein, transcription factor and mRNA splicing factor [Pyrenophora tritici-repentis]